MTCTATTKAGKQCRNKAIKDGRCRVHEEVLPAPLSTDPADHVRAMMEQSEPKLGKTYAEILAHNTVMAAVKGDGKARALVFEIAGKDTGAGMEPNAEPSEEELTRMEGMLTRHLRAV